MMSDDWPWRLDGPCTVIWQHDPVPKNATCELVRMAKTLIYSGDIEIDDWDGKQTPRGLLRINNIEMDVTSARFSEREGDGPRRVALFVTSTGAPRRRDLR